MSNSKAKDIAGTAVMTAAAFELIGAVKTLALMWMDPEQLVEQKKYLKENRQILMTNFTK